MKAWVVCDLGFGDAGKGSITDWLVRETGSKLVVRYNGGAQAGHTVVTDDGRTHTFAQFGSGTFVPGVRTHLSRFVVVHPGGLLVEAERLARIGVRDALERLSIHADARVVTPFHQAAGQLRELARGAARHGSCGIGVGETVGDALAHPEDAIRVHDLGDPRPKLARIRERYRAEFPRAEPFEDDTLVDRWLDSIRAFRDVRLADDAIPNEPVVFEGAHGVLLDEWRGFHPHTTWSTCTFDHALDLLRGYRGEIVRLGVLRTYMTRHGPGPFPTEERALDFPEPPNPTGEWQGAFRLGWLDAVLARYAIAACGGVDSLALTHCDRFRPGFRMARAYDDFVPALGPARDLAHQESLGARVARARPRYESFDTLDDFVRALEEHLGARVALASHGPTASAKTLTGCA